MLYLMRLQLIDRADTAASISSSILCPIFFFPGSNGIINPYFPAIIGQYADMVSVKDDCVIVGNVPAE